MRGPDRIGVFQDWSYHGIIAFQFDLSWVRFLCRNALTDRALDVMLVMCVDQDKSLVIVTPKYLVDETSLIEMSLMV